MKIIGIEHIGLAVQSIAKSEKFYREILGLEFRGQKDVPAMGLRAKFFGLGQSSLEIMEPLGDKGPVQQHLRHIGQGVQHIALKVLDFDEAVDQMRQAKVWLIGEPQEREGRRVCFIHPLMAGGVVIELIASEPGAGSDGSSLP